MAWPGWAFWAFVILFLQAFRALPVPSETRLTLRAKGIVVAVAVAFGLTFMHTPVSIDTMPDPCATPP